LLAISKLLAIRTLLVQQRLASQQSCHPAIISDPANLSEPAILRDSAKISNPATLSNPAMLCNFATMRNPAMPSNSATLSNPSMLSDAYDVTLTSSSQSEEIHINHSTPTASNSFEGSTTAVVAVTQQPRWRNFECNLYKMALKIAPAEKFLLNVQPELHQAIGERSCTNSNICTQSIYCTK
jgi:hypothetical protein